MKVGLFDLYSSGHHLQYASSIKRALSDTSDLEISFITLSKTDEQTSYFSRDELIYLDSPEKPVIEDRKEDFMVVADDTIEQFFANFSDRYDLVHLLYIDDILGPLLRHTSSNVDQKIIGDLIGPFFTRWTKLRKPLLHRFHIGLLQSPLAGVVDRLVPRETQHEALWRDLLLYRCLNHSVFDSILVHSREAQSYVNRLHPAEETVARFVPHLAPNWFDDPLSQQQARRDLDLPETGLILLFFGTLRSDKGIDVLLDALRQYVGPQFTMLIAGPLIPENPIGRAEINETNQESSIEIISKLEFIADPEPYYRAVDGVILPYTWEFGKENMSMILQEATASQRPVITPDFGVLGRLTRENNLGLTFKRESSDDLAATIADFVQTQPHNLDRNLRNYAKRNTYDRVGEVIENVYDTPG